MYELEAVKTLISRYRTCDPFELCDCLGVNVAFNNLGKIRGYYVKNRRSKFIILSSTLEPHQKRIVCAHELGHAILHPDLATPFYTEHTLLSKDRYEAEANRFAATLILASYDPLELDGLGTEQISILTGIPVELLRI